MDFHEAFKRTLGIEKGYVNNPKDPGGETKFGISKRSYPDEDIANLTLKRAKEIYFADFWNRNNCEQLPGWINGDVFDASVLLGQRKAAICLQKSVGATPDGIIGVNTIAKARASDPGVVRAKFYGEYLFALTDARGWIDFGKGWARRIASNLVGN